MKTAAVLLLAVSLMAAGPAWAEVMHRTEQGFVSGAELDVPGKTPLEVWQTLIAPARWWDPLQSWSGDPANMFLDPQAGGCFCELLPKPKGAPDDLRRGSIEHMRVIAAMPPKLLRMSGALGPLQGEAVAGTLTVVLKPIGGDGKPGTHLTWSYVVGGYMRMPADDIAPLVDRVLTGQFGRLAATAAAATLPLAAPADTTDGEHR